MLRTAGLVVAIAACGKPPPRAPAKPVPAQQPVRADEGSLEKRRKVVELLARGAVLIHLDARRPDVVVPAKHRADPGLVLRIGYGLLPPIPDLTLNDARLTATLSFDHKPFLCVIPWRAVYAAIVEGEATGTVWRADTPPDLPRDATRE